ncbi:MAG TPA: ribose-phosphate pyrophosphokinase [Anaerolineae bacterium]|nr:ribose-phosphate pyrophosphokinase [Anaerolineae bacterium]HMR67379.1 ribose-phosphate pyrophosphokinase [Anaerolineae bacterium]
MYGEIALFSGNGNLELAQEISAALAVPLCPADVFKFSNQNIFCRLKTSVRGKDVFIIQPIAMSYDRRGAMQTVNDNLMELLIMIDTAKRDSAGRITAVVPYYGYGRTDKKDQPRVPITARLVADLITTAGANRFLTIDLHAGQIQGFFNIPVDEITAFYSIRDYIREKNIPNAVVVAGDIGATKRSRNFAQALDLPLVVIEKRRLQKPDGSKTEVLNIIGDVRGKNCIIYDDEIDTAGTVVQAMDFLKQCGAEDIYTCVTHAILSGPAVQRLIEAPVKEVVATNTVAISPDKDFAKLTRLSVAPLIAEVIRRVHLGISVGELFDE